MKLYQSITMKDGRTCILRNGTERDAEAVLDASGKGVTVLAAAHGRSLGDLNRRPVMQTLMHAHVFDRIVILKGVGQCAAVLDADGKPISA